MKRTFATLGVVGLAAFAATAPAVADRGSDSDDKILICHAGSGSNAGHFTLNSVAVPSLNGHDNHGEDIIPPNDGMKYGQNWDAIGRAIHANGCVLPPVVVPPVVVPPVVVDPPVEQPVEQPVVNPPGSVNQPVVETPVVVTAPVEQPAVVPPVTVPPAATAVVVPQQQAAAAADAVATTGLGTNQGYNAQTAVGGSDSPSWLAGAGALMAAGAAVAFRRSRRSLPLAD
ncbi:conserved exported hypothetical protein [Arthrobacter sp. 9AX]|uniref:LPXTG cell wall anchor domain-containing protein n=1 Tax=Arthrobacter sp. 9AX TaxID=2653131 RepID=UPI0012F316B1|nr:LPXTG cell wall anchor domain-containing protein [Arthrobacter sp. 9AX]VXA98031.1 conserved exported hypothetical protein [Arthrobacter sp. 9AX]